MHRLSKSGSGVLDPDDEFKIMTSDLLDICPCFLIHVMISIIYFS
jgi:hypothetical protein